MELEGTPVVVLGMLRSGTSSVTQALQKLGVNLGDAEQLKPADVDNRDGYWEHEWMRNANHHVMWLLGMITDHAKMLPPDWREYERIDMSIGRVRDLLKKTFAGNALWGWKDPPTTLLVPAYQQVFADLGVEPRYVICVRNPLDVAASMLRRAFNQSTEREALGEWLQYTLCALHDTMGAGRTLIVYHEFLADPVRCLRPLVDSVKGWTPGADAWDEVKRVPRKDLNHGGRSADELVSIEPSIIRRTFELCLQACATPDAFERGDFDSAIQALWDEFQAWRSIYPSTPVVLTRFSLNWRVPGDPAPKQAMLEYRPSPKRQTLRLAFEAPAGTMIVGELASAPGTLMVRSMVLQDQNGNVRSIQPEVLAGVGFTKAEDVALWAITGPGSHFAFPMPPGGKFEFVVEIAVDANVYEIARIARAAGQENAFLRGKVAELDSRARALSR